MTDKEKPKWGGARQGSGRPKKEKTVRISVPEGMADRVRAFIRAEKFIEDLDGQ